MAAEVRPLVFLGTPPAAAVVLERLVDAGFEVVHVVTRPDAKRGRGSSLSPSPVKEVALRLGIPVSHGLEWVVAHREENLLGIVVAYGRIIPASILAHTPMINIHFSLLPRWRGAAPVERAILAGDTTTGVCIMDIEETLDTGAVYAREEVAISDAATSVSLTNELAQTGADLLVRTLKAGLGTPIAQGDGETLPLLCERSDSCECKPHRQAAGGTGSEIRPERHAGQSCKAGYGLRKDRQPT